MSMGRRKFVKTLGVLTTGATSLYLGSKLYGALGSDKGIIYGGLEESGVMEATAYDTSDISINDDNPFLGGPSDYIYNEFVDNQFTDRSRVINSYSEGMHKIDVVYITTPEKNDYWEEFREVEDKNFDNIKTGLETLFDGESEVDLIKRAEAELDRSPRDMKSHKEILRSFKDKGDIREDASLMVYHDYHIPGYCSAGFSISGESIGFMSIPVTPDCDKSFMNINGISSTTVHEMLHGFGLPHTSIRGDLMNERMRIGPELEKVKTLGLTNAIIDTMKTYELVEDDGGKITFEMNPKIMTDDEEANIVARNIIHFIDKIGLSDRFGSRVSKDDTEFDGEISYRFNSERQCSLLFERDDGKDIQLEARGRRLLLSDYNPSEFTSLDLTPLEVRERRF